MSNYSINFSNISFEAKSAKFLNLNSIVVGGNAPYFDVQVMELVSDASSPEEIQFVNTAEYLIQGRQFEELELCSLYNTAYLAVSATSRGGEGSIKILNLPGYGMNDGKISERHELPRPPLAPSVAPYVSISICPPGILASDCILAAANECGDVFLWDFNIGKLISTIHVDSVGVNKVLFSSSGELCTAGSSSNSQFKVWDIRSCLSLDSSSTPNLKPVIQCKHPTSQFSPSTKFPSYTSLCNHSVLPKIICGSNNGDIVTWDLRSGSGSNPSSLTQSHQAAVTSICVHPNACKRDQVMSSSVDGSVRITNIANELMDCVDLENNILLSEPASITSIDSIYPNLVLASSSIGGMWRFGIE